MRTYRVYFLARGDEVVGSQSFNAADDRAAKAKAEELCRDHPGCVGGGDLGRRLAAVPASVRRKLGWLSTNPFGSNSKCCEAQALIQKKKYVNFFI